MPVFNAMIVITPEDCVAQTCDCKPTECQFKSCLNCDGLVDDDGITCDPRGCCFYCKAD